MCKSSVVFKDLIPRLTPGSNLFNDEAVFFDPGLIFQQVHPQPALIQRRSEQPPGEVVGLEEDIQEALHQIRSLSEHEDDDAHGAVAEGPNQTNYSSSLGSFYRVFQTLLTERFLEELPRTAVCLLSGAQDCGPEADLVKAVSLDLINPLLGFVSALRSQSCSAGPRDAESSGASLWMVEPTPGASGSLQQSILTALSRLPSSGNLLGTLRGLVDATVTYALKSTATALRVPVDYVKLALQFGIGTPSLDDKETCEQGERVSRCVETGLG